MADPHKFIDPAEAYSRARRSILNNALRRRQQSLDLSGYGLEELPPEIGQLTELTSLDLSNNKLAVLPPEIGKMSALFALSLANNSDVLPIFPPVIS